MGVLVCSHLTFTNPEGPQDQRVADARREEDAPHARQAPRAGRHRDLDSVKYLQWVDKYQAQLVVLAAQISWSEDVDRALQAIESSGKGSSEPLSKVLQVVESTLNVLADSVLHEQPPVRRRKLEHLVRLH